jgi:hypothetical protein
MSQGFMFLTGYMIVIWAGVYAQYAASAEAIISRGFDAGLSIGLLIVGLIVIGVYHWRYQKITREDLQTLTKEKDEKADKFHDLSMKQLEVAQDQIQANKDLKRTLDLLIAKLEKD